MFQKGNKINLGRKATERTKRKLSEMRKGHFVSEETRRKIGLANSIALKGHKLSEEAKRKISIANKGKPSWIKGRKHLEETKKKIGKANEISMLGNKNGRYRKGIKHTKEAKRKMSEAHKGMKKPWVISPAIWGDQKGENSPAWKGGISCEPYSVDWTEDLKKAIRKRDKYTCQICGAEPAIYCHHIDYDKKNCNPKNLITLCHSCHSKTNFNRDYWKHYFINLIL